MTTPGLSRRTAVRGAALAGIGLPLLVACSEDETSRGSAGAEGGNASEASPDASEAGGGLASTADVPVGGGVVVKDAKVVVVQPAAGDFKAYSAVCPHQGCILSEVVDNSIRCGDCHHSEYSAEDGHNTVGPNGGPADLPALETVDITVEGDSIALA